MRMLGHEIAVSEDVPPDELWLTQPTGSITVRQEVTPSGDLRVAFSRAFAILGKIRGLAS
jgi:hypothetical protein